MSRAAVAARPREECRALAGTVGTVAVRHPDDGMPPERGRPRGQRGRPLRDRKAPCCPLESLRPRGPGVRASQLRQANHGARSSLS